MLLSLFCMVLFTSPFQDDKLDYHNKSHNQPTSFLQIASIWFIGLHQNHLTHTDGPRSHFSPCSSRYMKEAILKYGFFKGSLLGLDRLMRENQEPWVYPQKKLDADQWIKSDPVP